MSRWGLAYAIAALLIAGCESGGEDSAPEDRAASSALTATPTLVPATFGDGRYRVGTDVAPGRYRAVAPTEECEWQRLRSFDGPSESWLDDDVIGSGSGFTIPFVDIAPSDLGFVSSGCGEWVSDLSPRITPDRPFGDGVWLVGSEIAPGRYRTAEPVMDCGWWRLSGFSGEYFHTGDVGLLEDLVDGGYAEGGYAIAEIAASDAAFASYGCGEWSADLSPRIAPGEPFGSGTFMVGSEIAPGRYRSAPTVDRTCHWHRLGGFGGFRQVSLGYEAVDSGSGSTIADIEPSDAGFSSRGCQAWTLEPTASDPVSRTSFGDGTHIVGRDIAAGRYRASEKYLCRWKRLSGFGGADGDVIASGNSGRGTNLTIVDILPGDAGFRTSRCGTWTSDLSPTIAPGAPFSSAFTEAGSGDGLGTYFVGPEIAPGRYQASDAAHCRWMRLSGFSGSGDDLIELVQYGDVTGSLVVEIAPTDTGFFSFFCGTWTPVTARPTALRAVPVAPPPGVPPPPRIVRVGDGRWRIDGADGIPPGRYRAAAASDGCTWSLRRGGNGRSDADHPRAIVDITALDREFATSGCGAWTNDPAPIVRRGEPFGDGTFLVGSEIAPGRYRASDPGECTWMRLRSFDGWANPVQRVSYGAAGGSGIADVEPSDAGFYSRGCGTWTSVSR